VVLTYHFGLTRRQIDAWRSGPSKYLFWVRAEGDPERRTPGLVGAYGVDPHNKLNRMDLEQLRRLAWGCLSAVPGEPMTFNAMSVILFDLTADVTGQTAFEDAVWSLVADGCVAMTLEAPVLLMRSIDLTDTSRPAPAYVERADPVQLHLF